MEQITVVMAIRLGKGQKWLPVWKKQGGRAVVVPGMAADMKLGDMMKAENATFGISFCGQRRRGCHQGPTPNMAIRPNTACVPWRRGRDRHQRRLHVLGLALRIKKSWASVWYRRGRRNTAHKA